MFFTIVLTLIVGVVSGVIANYVYDWLRHRKRQGESSQSEPGAKQGDDE